MSNHSKNKFKKAGADGKKLEELIREGVDKLHTKKVLSERGPSIGVEVTSDFKMTFKKACEVLDVTQASVLRTAATIAIKKSGV